MILSRTNALLCDAEGMDNSLSLLPSNAKAAEREEKIFTCAQQVQRMANESFEFHALAKQLHEPPPLDVPVLRDDPSLPKDKVFPIEGHMLKRSSCLRACVGGRSSSRFFRLDGSRLRWWRQLTLTHMPAVGCIDLLADEVEVHVLRDVAFKLRPKSGIWKTSKLNDGRGNRGGVVLDTIDSEFSLQQWVNHLGAAGARCFLHDVKVQPWW
jgi:hypothetical protein